MKDHGPRRMSRRSVLAGLTGLVALAASRRTLAQPVSNPVHEPLQEIGEISYREGRLRAELAMTNVARRLPGTNAMTRLRAFVGTDPITGHVWPPVEQAGRMNPGPTLRARVGDFVEIAFFNEVDVSEFGEGGIDRGETGTEGGCELTVNAVSGDQVYPVDADAYPNCFHASSTTNVHFHGFHVTPDGLGDNVLLKVRPKLDLPKEEIRRIFDEIFASTSAGVAPKNWLDLPAEWIGTQLQLLAEHDGEALWNGIAGALPEANRLLPAVEAEVAAGLWPQYAIGAYPFSFQVTPDPTDAGAGHVHPASGAPTTAGQAPGTHWYHAHVHGSTAINLLQGIAGVFIVEGKGYDGKLKALLPNLVERVLIVQQFAEYPAAMVYAGDAPLLAPHVNGQLEPMIHIRPGEVQLWRLVNATVDMVSSIDGFTRTPSSNGVAPPTFMQCAQDGVQFSPDAYAAQPFKKSEIRLQHFAPGNRVDILVAAPVLPPGVSEASFDFLLRHDPMSSHTPKLVRLKVEGEPKPNPMRLPTRDEFPERPAFLADIPDTPAPRISRTLVFAEPGGSNPDTAGPSINGREFQDGRYDQTIVLGDTEEWTLQNITNTADHPFHIHVNPFQVVEIKDSAGTVKFKDVAPLVWQDVVAIPRSGSVKIRHRFEDFTGSFVLHCHILEHEDRGMMQLVRVVSSHSLTRHH